MMEIFEEHLKDLKKDIVESRNLIIKTDNLVKNLSADVKQLQKKFENYEQRSMLTSIAAYIIFVVLIFIGLWAAFNSKLSTFKADRTALNAQIEEMRAKNEALAKQLEQADLGADRAADLWDKLNSRNPEEGLKLVQSADLGALPKFARKILEEKEASVREKLGMEALDQGRRAFNSQRWKDATGPLTRAIEILPKGLNLSNAHYMRGYSNYELRNWKEGAEDFGRVVELAPSDPYADDAQYFRAFCFEQLRDLHNARVEYEKALRQYPSSGYVNTIKTRLQTLTNPPGSAPAQSTP